MLVYVEAKGTKIKSYKSYYRVTFVIYELVGLLTLVAYAYPIMHLFTIEYSTIALQNAPCDEKFIYISEVTYLITTFIILITHWIKHSIVHISMCRSVTLSVSTFEGEISILAKPNEVK